ncbi:MAG TPA: hypothetical protein VGB26_12480 [Nitrospiria bacterium]
MNKFFMIGAGLVFMLAACTQQGEEVKMLDKAKGAASEAEKMATEATDEAGKMDTGDVGEAGKMGSGAEKLATGADDEAGKMVTGTKDSLTGTATDAAKKAGEIPLPLK